MKKIISIISASLFVFAISYAAPTDAQKAGISELFAPTKAAYDKGEFTVAAVYALVDANETAIKPFADWAIATPAEYSDFILGGNYVTGLNTAIRRYLDKKGIKPSELAKLALDDSDSAVFKTLTDYSALKAAGFKVDGVRLYSNMIWKIALASGNIDNMLDACVNESLAKTLPHFERALASADAKTAWQTYNRLRKIYAPKQKAAPDAWTQLLSDEYLAYKDYERSK